MSITVLLAAAALLMAPGPTNILYAAAGAGSGVRRSVRLMPVGLAAYLLSIMLLVLLFGEAARHEPGLGHGLQAAAAAWLGWTALRLWRGAARQDGPAATPARMFWTTTLNPKALIFAFGLYPATGPAIAIGLFVPLFLAAAMAWIVAGSLARRGARGVEGGRIARATALANALFATLILGGLAQAATS